ncbi:hypothetical protein RKD37_001290 [Streptomyces ambofaciens]
MRPDPAPLTDTERATAKAHLVFDVTTAKSERSRSRPETVPVYLADAGDHDALLDTFLDEHGEFEKWRTWSDDTTHPIHESQTLRIERVHETPANETAWTVAAYETPVSDRIWVLTATGTTPAPVLRHLLIHLADGDGWDTAISAPVDEKMVTAATQSLSEAGWKHTVDGRWIHWTSPDGDAGMQFDAFAAQHPGQNQATWTIWAGPGPRPAHLGRHRVPAHSEFAPDRSLRVPRPRNRPAPPTDRGPRTQDKALHQPAGHAHRRRRLHGQPVSLNTTTQERASQRESPVKGTGDPAHHE